MGSVLSRKISFCGVLLFWLSTVLSFANCAICLYLISTDYITDITMDEIFYARVATIILAYILISAGFALSFLSSRFLPELISAVFVAVLAILEVVAAIAIFYNNFFAYTYIILNSLFAFVLVVYAMQSNRRYIVGSVITGAVYAAVRLDRGFDGLISRMIRHTLGCDIMDIIFNSLYLIIAGIFVAIFLECMKSPAEQYASAEENAGGNASRNEVSLDSLFAENSGVRQDAAPVKKTDASRKASASDMMDNLLNS